MLLNDRLAPKDPHLTQGGLPIDCLIIGGGPAGLTAAVYLARFRRRVLVIDAGHSRLLMIPRTRNVAGFPDGIEGKRLLAHMQQHAKLYNASIKQAEAIAVSSGEFGFEIKTTDGVFQASSLLFASGVANNTLEFAEHDEAVGKALLRYCPICDGYEVTGQRVAIIGNSRRSESEKAFLGTYTHDVTIFAADQAALELMRRDGVPVADVVQRIEIRQNKIVVVTGSRAIGYDAAYSCLGVRPRSGLAVALGVSIADEGEILADQHQRTNVPFVYVAGDVVSALDQIVVAMGHGAIAATSIHNDLSARDTPTEARA